MMKLLAEEQARSSFGLSEHRFARRPPLQEPICRPTLHHRVIERGLGSRPGTFFSPSALLNRAYKLRSFL